MTSDFDFDLFVIGGGSGGVRAARVAAEKGARVALAEEYRMGGTCVIRGCVPKKLMVFAADNGARVEEARAYGWQVERGAFDWPAFRERLAAEVSRLEGIYRANLDRAGVVVHDQRARIADPHAVELADGTRITARHILIATGAAPYVPEQAPGVELGITSNEIFDIEEQPRELLVIGGGYIACEFACIFQGLGTRVTQWYRGAQILRGFDGEARGHIAELIRGQGIDLHVGADVERLERLDDGRIRALATDGREVVVDQVLFATGRRPKTAGLGLEEIGLRPGRNGAVQVDEYGQTAVPSVWAVGDVTDRLNLTPVAIRDAMAFVATVFEGRPTPVDHELVASAVFTRPEFGTVGLGEEEAAEREAIEVYCAAFRPMRTQFVGRPERVLFKLVVSRETRRVLGCHIVADGAAEIIQLAAVALKMGATKEDFDRTVAVHPTMSEEIVLMRTPVRVLG